MKGTFAQASDRGSSLFLMIGTAALISILLAGLLHEAASLVGRTELAACRNQCRALAEGGLEVARSNVANGAKLQASEEITISAPSGNCLIWMEPDLQEDTFFVVVEGQQLYRPNCLAAYKIQATLNKDAKGYVYQVVSQKFVPRSEE